VLSRVTTGLTGQDAPFHGLRALTARRLAALAERVVAQPILAAGLKDRVAAVAAAGNTLRRAYTKSAGRVADFAVFAACAVTALLGGATARGATALSGGATARGATAVFGITAFGATEDLIRVAFFLGKSLAREE